MSFVGGTLLGSMQGEAELLKPSPLCYLRESFPLLGAFPFQFEDRLRSRDHLRAGICFSRYSF